ncbi:hypothetical protein [Vitiosangium sp. GDMCC 1.1324]|uniref:hypothetical protein n=1 Tax=Vitiosangium sp. (strain GDMCC 1.1324) TaxID=2138576 RepID=UPI000D3AE647|nr:hypothetical protein [Vitiosangium sp. GDMCC 1.1324]PTL83466.1 hypothetical protein DAT35_15985 [Vitiosangium sp. GDMCC 1.1324]
MRILLFLVALLAGGFAGYLQFFNKTPYSSYSKAQLDQLEAEHSRQLQSASGDAYDTHLISLAMIREERERPLKVQMALGGAGVSFITALVLTLVRSRRRDDSSRDEAQAPAHEPVGHYASPSKASRAQAAALLGVRPDAPRAVIEAALQAQLAERDPALLHGLAPDLRQRILQQREELLQAGNLLLGRQEIPFSPDGSQG